MADREWFNSQIHYKKVDSCFNMEFGCWEENFTEWKHGFTMKTSGLPPASADSLFKNRPNF